MGAAVQIVEDNSLRATADGYELGVRLNWYRSLPLSCIDKVALTLDGKPVDPAATRFEVNGKQFGIDDMQDKIAEFWFVQDTARLHVQQPGKVRPGEAHTVEVEIALRLPYIFSAPGKCVIMTTNYATSQVAS